MSHFAVSAVGRDRPGIVAEISQVLLAAGGNIEDSKMSILRGQFAVMLIVAGPDGLERGRLEERLEPLRERLGLDAIAVSEVAGLQPGQADAQPTHVVSVYGSDHPGIVHGISRALADTAASITDLETKLVGLETAPVYVMVIEVRVPDDLDPAGLGAELKRIGHEAGLEVSLNELGDDAL